MPYGTIKELPKNTSKLPKHTKEIFMETFNNTWKQYNQDEVTAQKAAWSAVKRKYKKAGDKWAGKSL